MPGTGGSETPLLPRPLYGLAGLAARVLDVLGYPQAIDVLGISWGGALAQEFVLRFPRRVRRLVLAATSTWRLGQPGDPRALWVLATPARHVTPDYFGKIAATHYRGARGAVA